MVKDQSGTVDQRFGRQLIYNTLQRLSSLVFRNRYRAHLSLSMRKKAQRFSYIFFTVLEHLAYYAVHLIAHFLVNWVITHWKEKHHTFCATILCWNFVLCCFMALEMSNTSFDLTVAITSTCSSGYPTSFVTVIQIALRRLLLTSCLHGCERVMVTRTELRFSPSSVCAPTSESDCDPAAPNSVDHPANTLLWLRRLLSYFAWHFQSLQSVLLLAFPVTPDITVLFFFRVLADCPFWKREYLYHQ